MAKQNILKKDVECITPQEKSQVLRVVHTITSDSNPKNLDRLIHERIRLGIVSALAVNESLSFKELKKILKASDGNLSVHARKLEEAEYITCQKSFDGRIPKTEYRLTSDGRKALKKYLSHMEALIQSMQGK